MTVRDVLPRDAIPSIDDPAFDAEYFGGPEDEVVALDGDPPRAYPVRILSYHEVVNDVVDGRPVAVTWCPICASAVVYDRRVDGRTLTVGVSGKLADDALVLYDRETGSEWRQTSGECIAGPLSGATLEPLPAPLVPLERFRADHPDGVVLRPAGDPERYDMSRYEQYAAADEFGLYGMRGEGERRTWDRTDIDAKTVVLGVVTEGGAVGYPRPRVDAAGGVVADTVGERDVLVVAVADGFTAFADPGFGSDSVESVPGGFRADGARWDGVTGESDDGRRLERLPTRRLYAFAWQDVHGPDAFYDGA